MGKKDAVQLNIRSVYGNELIYPANATAQLFATLTGRKTFTLENLRTIRALGFELENDGHGKGFGVTELAEKVGAIAHLNN